MLRCCLFVVCLFVVVVCCCGSMLADGCVCERDDFTERRCKFRWLWQFERVCFVWFLPSCVLCGFCRSCAGFPKTSRFFVSLPLPEWPVSTRQLPVVASLRGFVCPQNRSQNKMWFAMLTFACDFFGSVGNLSIGKITPV